MQEAACGVPSGMVARMASSYFLSILEVISDAMKPGAIALDVIFLLANSLANVFVSPSTPACSIQQSGVNVSHTLEVILQI